MSEAVRPDATRYRRSVRAWVTYDWANSAFATTVLAAVLPVYYSTVAGSTLDSPATATQYYTLTLSASVLVLALISPLAGAVADLAGTRKRFLLAFMVLGVGATAAMFGVNEGDWLLASLLFGVGRVGFGGANVFYDALLPHVAAVDDVDRVSARGFAFGYLGGGLLLAADVALIVALPDDHLGVRLSLLSVAVWWAAFSLPLARHVAEPPGTGGRRLGEAVRRSAREVVTTFKGMADLPDLRRYLVAFLIYNDAINVVITVAAIYGAELGFGAMELTLAILLVQFVGGPYSLLFGALPTTDSVPRRRRMTAFVLANIVLLPLAGIALRVTGPADLTGVAGTPFADEGIYQAGDDVLDFQPRTSWGITGPSSAEPLARTSVPGSAMRFAYTGQSLEVTYGTGPRHGDLAVLLDGEPVLDDGEPRLIEGANPALRTGETVVIDVVEAGPHELVLQLLPPQDLDEEARATIQSVEVLPPSRESSLPLILALILIVQLVAAALAATVLTGLVAPLADAMTTKRAIQLSLVAYAVIAVWGFVLDSVVEFWLLAWLVAVVQGGSQALSRSLYTRLIPDARSGEFFGFFSILSKFASFLSPLLFVLSVALFDSSRPAVLSLAVFFAVGLWLLGGVDVERGKIASGD